MIVLALDPGAKRLGYAVVEDGEKYTLYTSGLLGLERDEKEPFQRYRRRLMLYWCRHFPLLLESCSPDLVVSEIVPAVGNGNFVAATQSELVKVVVTTCQVIAHFKHVEWREIAANTIKKELTGNGKATKVAVRNTVCQVFSELESRKQELVADETDAIATALVALGFRYG